MPSTILNDRRVIWACCILTLGILPSSFSEETLGERIARLDAELMQLHPELFEIPLKPEAFKAVYLDEAPAEQPIITLVLEFPGRLEGAGHATLGQWQVILHDPNATVPPGFNGFGSYTDFAGPGDPKVYRFGSMDVTTDAQNGPITVAQARDENFNLIIPLILKGDVRIIANKGDTVPRETTPEFTGTTFTEFGPPVFSGSDVVFPGYGQNFSGIYRAPIVPGELSVVAENFSAAGNQLGDIAQVDSSNGNIYFTSSSGVYRVKNEAGSAPELLAASGSEYAPGKTWQLPRSIDVDGDKLVFDAFDQDFNSSVFFIQNAAGAIQDISVNFLAGADTPVPGGTENFTGAQRPVVSGDLMVFEAFGPSGQLGVFAQKNDTLIPLVKKGDSLEGKLVNLVVHERGSALGNQVGLVVHFQDFTSAPYIYTIGASPGVLRFTPGSASYSPTEGFSAKFAGVPGKTYKLEYFSLQNPGPWQGDVSVTYSGGEQTVTDPGARGDSARLYRLVETQ